MIKFLVGGVIILALIGGAVQFKSTDKDWSLVVNKEEAKSSVQNGIIKVYDFGKALFDSAVENTDLILSKDNSSAKP
ncbi:MAG: hypothetical protein PSN36_06705 [Gammaproteobacteria bacterium]|nr:hypothetical protein [Gammaproteobacteria bacterium]